MLKKLKIDILGNDLSGVAFASVRSSLSRTEGALASFQSRSRAVGRNLSIAGAAASAAITLPVAAFARDALRLFDAQEQAVTAVRQAVESTGGAAGFTTKELQRMASGIQDLTTFGDENILQNVTAPLLTFTKISGDVFEQAQTAILDMSTLLKTDLRSSAIQVGKALNDPIKGVTALGLAGVQFTEDQKKVIKSLVETGQVAAAQQIILGELQIQFGGQAAAAAKTSLGPLKQLSNAWGDLKEEVGAILVPVLIPVVNVLKSMVKGFGELSPGVKKFTVIGIGLAAVVGPLVGVLGLLAAGIGAISAPVLAVVAGVAALTAGLAAFWPEIVAGYETVKGALTDLVAFIEQPLSDIVEQTGDFLVDQLGAVWEDVKAGVLVVRGVFVSVFGEEIVSAVEGSAVQIFEISKRLVEGVHKWLVEGLLVVRDRIAETLGSIKDAFLDLWHAVVGGSIVPDMVVGVEEWFDRMRENMLDTTLVATAGVQGQFDKMLGGVSEDVDRMGGVVETGFGSIGETITGPFREALRGGELSFKSFGESLIAIGQRFADKLVDGAFQQISDGIDGLFASRGGSSGGGGGGGLLGGLLGGLGGLFGGGGGGAGLLKGVSGSSAGLFGFHRGTSFTVGGRGGQDQNVIAFRASRGERVDVTPRGGGSEPQPVMIRIEQNLSFVDAAGAREASGVVAQRTADSVRRAQAYL